MSLYRDVEIIKRADDTALRVRVFDAHAVRDRLEGGTPCSQCGHSKRITLTDEEWRKAALNAGREFARAVRDVAIAPFLEGMRRGLEE